MSKLADLVEVTENNMECVILKVKPNSQVGLIALGCFDGDETMFRLTKGCQHTCTVWDSNGNHFDWDWGSRGFTIVSEKLNKMGSLIQSCIQRDLEIYMGEDKAKREATLYKDKPAHASHIYKLLWWGGANDCENAACSTHCDGEFLGTFTENGLRAMLADNGYRITNVSIGMAQTRCWVKEFWVEK